MSLYVRVTVVCLLVAGGATACFAWNEGTPAQPPLPRKAIPESDAISQSQQLIRQVYESDFQAASSIPEPLVQKLLKAAADTGDDARRYALMIEAEEVAARASDYGRVMSLIEERAKVFLVNSHAARVEKLASCLTPKAKSNPDVLRNLYKYARETARRAEEQEALAEAKQAAELSASVAKAMLLAGKARKDGVLAKDGESKMQQAKMLVKAIEHRRSALAEYQEALEKLKHNPTDRAANGVVGRYLCVENADWDTGLPRLAESDQEPLASLAAEELRTLDVKTPDARSLFLLAGRWWEAADADDESEAFTSALRRHAASLYSIAFASLEDPLEKALAQKRMQEAPPAPVMTGGAAGPRRAGRPKDAIEWKGHFYQLVVTERAISKAHAAFLCGQSDGALVNVETEQELRFLQEMIGRAPIPNGKYHTGGFRMSGQEVRWMWSNGVPADEMISLPSARFGTDNWNDEGSEVYITKDGFFGFRARWGEGYICEWE